MVDFMNSHNKDWHLEDNIMAHSCHYWSYRFKENERYSCLKVYHDIKVVCTDCTNNCVELSLFCCNIIMQSKARTTIIALMF